MEPTARQPGKAAWIAALALGLALMLPSLFSGFVLDDYIYLEALHGRIPFRSPADELYRFFDGDVDKNARLASGGFIPWWAEDDIRIAFFRPSSAFLMRAENRLFPDRPLAHHLHCLIWWAALLAAVAWLYRRLFSGRIAWLAFLLFALDESHVLPAAWISNRNALVAITPALVGLAAHLRWREEGWRPGLPLSVAGLSVGLLGGEMALGIAAYFVAYEMTSAPGREWHRLLRLSPIVAVVAVYAVVRTALRYGSASSAIYVDPTADPLGFLGLAVVRIPALVGAAMTGFWADLWVVVPELRPLQVVLGILGAVALAGLLRLCWPALGESERRQLRWLLVGASLALVPSAATFPADRLLLPAALGYCPAIAVVLYAAWKTRPRRWIAIAGLALALVHLVLAPLSGVLYQVGLGTGARQTRQLARAAPIPDSNRQHAIVLWAPDYIVGLYLPLVRQNLGHSRPASWRLLSLAPYDHRFTRTSEDTLVAEIVGGSMMGGLFEKLYRDSPLVEGDELDRGLLRVEILDANQRGPTRVAFRFDRPLDDDSLVFLAWTAGDLRRLPAPRIGEFVSIPRTLGPAGF